MAIHDEGWSQFTSREVLRSGLPGLTSADDINPALKALQEADIAWAVEATPSTHSGRPTRIFTVNPAVHRRMV